MVVLEEYQKNIVKEITNRKNLLVSSHMGSGKTLSSLFGLGMLKLEYDISKILIVAPKFIARNIWEQEAAKLEYETVRFCDTSADIYSFLSEPLNQHICICSVTKIQNIPHKLWDMVVLDECTLYGNKASKRSKEVRRLCNGVKRRLFLTGTLYNRGFEKLWHIYFLLDGGQALGKTLTDFRERFMRVKYQAHGVVTVYEIREDKIQELIDSVKHLTYVVTRDMMLESNVNMTIPVEYTDIYIDLPTKRMKEYKVFEKDSVIRFTGEFGQDPFTSPKLLMTFSTSGRGIKLRQLASGVVYIDEERKEYVVTHTEKLNVVKEILEISERGVLLAYQFINEREEILKAFPQARVIKDSKDITDWNEGKIPLAIAHPASIGHGLNLQFGGSTIIWYSLTYDVELYSQFNARLPRRGQTDCVNIIRLIARGTIDEKVKSTILDRETIANKYT